MLLSFEDYIKIKFKNKKDKKKLAKEKKYLLFNKFCDNISKTYIKEKCEDNKNKIFLYMYDEFNLNSVIGIIMYRKILDTKEKIRIYLIILSIQENMRNYGYGQLLLDEFCNSFKNRNKYKNKKIEIVLLSLQSSINFYKKNDFIEKNNKFITNHEDIDDYVTMFKIL